MQLETLLTSLPPDQWLTSQAIVFDWYDGPREGVCALARPGGEFFFELLDERPTEEGLDERLFRVWQIPDGSVQAILALLRELGSPVAPVWVPVWRFATESAHQMAEQRINAIRSGARATALVIATPDLMQFSGCWTVDPARPPAADWFSALGIG